MLEESETVPPRPILSDEDKKALVRHIKRLAKVYDKHVKDPWDASHAYRVGGVNPFYHQTGNGLYLEFYYGGPSKVWTPWGEWTFAAAQPYETDLEGFMSRLTVREYIAERTTDMGVFGPVYAILAINGKPLPEPERLTDRRQYLQYEDAKAQWEKFFGTNYPTGSWLKRLFRRNKRRK